MDMPLHLSGLLDELESISREDRCRTCRCFQDTLQEFCLAAAKLSLFPPARERIAGLTAHADTLHDCLGCEPCLPVPVSNAIAEMSGRGTLPSGRSACAPAAARTIAFAGRAPLWPVELGEYVLGDPASPVAVCTLGSDSLPAALSDRIGRGAFALAGRTHTENIGIEKIVRNIVANPGIRFLVLCGREPKGHLPGTSLLELARNGIDDAQRIIGSPGQRPFLRNLGQAEVARFRVQVEIINQRGSEDIGQLAASVQDLGRRNPGKFDGTAVTDRVPVIEASDAGRLVLDPVGFFIIYPRKDTRTVLVEHYRNDGTLNAVITGADPALISLAAVERKLVSRLDHAAYLGREVEKAYRSMIHGFPYVQDSAPGK